MKGDICKGCGEPICGFDVNGYCEDCLCQNCGTTLETEDERAMQLCDGCMEQEDETC